MFWYQSESKNTLGNEQRLSETGGEAGYPLILGLREQSCFGLPLILVHMWVCLKMVSTPKPNGFADHYPNQKWLFHWEY